jgi:transcription elongation factor Elf1
VGRRRKKNKRAVKRIKKIPDIFQCPHCSQKSLVIKFEKSGIPGYKIAKIMCGSCGLYYEMQVPELYEPVDVYAEFLDKYENGEIKPEFRKPVESGETGGEGS